MNFTGKSPRLNFHSKAAKATETEVFTEANQANEGLPIAKPNPGRKALRYLL
jgi:hypothetical protein